MRDLRLGDVLDDFCIKCRRLTNHSIVSLVAGKAAKVRCRTCYNDHDFRNEQAPPSKKDLKKAALFNQVLASAGVPAGVDPPAAPDPPALDAAAAVAADPLPEAAEGADSKPARKKLVRKKA
jgi:hypothetical protein